LNELHEKFEESGLSIVGVTSESEGLTEKWIEEKGAIYPYAYDKGGKFKRSMGKFGLPHAFLVSPAGEIVWKGHPASLTESIVQANLEGSLRAPTWEWPREASSVRKHLSKRQFGKAINEADEIAGQNEELAQIRDALEGIVAARVKMLNASYEAGDFLGANDSATVIKKECAGVDAADEAAEVLKKISSDAEAKRVMKGQKLVLKLRDTEWKSRMDAAGLLKKANRLAEQYDGTMAGDQAKAFAAELEAAMNA